MGRFLSCNWGSIILQKHERRKIRCCGIGWFRCVLVDAAAVLTPVPGGAGAAIKATRATSKVISKADDVAKITDKVTEAVIKYGDDVKPALKETDNFKNAAKEGIYEWVDDAGKTYVGQSGDIPKRLKQHAQSGKLDGVDLTTIKTTEVVGDKTTREIAEHTRIQEITGDVAARKSEAVLNKVDPIGPSRKELLQ